MSVRRTSLTRAKPVITSDTGDTVRWSISPSCHTVCIDSESLPTGIEMSSCGHNSMPIALTASNSAASSPGWLTAAIQFADRRISPRLGIAAAAKLVIASPTASRAASALLSNATGARSAIAIASPA